MPNKPHSKGKVAINRKIQHLIHKEGKTPDQAAGQAYGMARQGTLGEDAKAAAGPERKKKV